MPPRFSIRISGHFSGTKMRYCYLYECLFCFIFSMKCGNVAFSLHSLWTSYLQNFVIDWYSWFGCGDLLLFRIRRHKRQKSFSCEAKLSNPMKVEFKTRTSGINVRHSWYSMYAVMLLSEIKLTISIKYLGWRKGAKFHGKVIYYLNSPNIRLILYWFWSYWYGWTNLVALFVCNHQYEDHTQLVLGRFFKLLLTRWHSVFKLVGAANEKPA